METSYTAEQIQVLEGLEGVRKRPSMYIGSVEARGLHQLVNELVENSVDEALAGFCSKIEVTIHSDGTLTVADNGRGIPVEIHPQTGKSALEVVMTMLHSGGKFDNKIYRISGGLHGIGLSVVNALSEWLEVSVGRDSETFCQRYERGHPVTPIEKPPSGNTGGTCIRFKPDGQIFEDTGFDFQTIANRLRELAFLTAGLTFTIRDERPQPPREKQYFYSDGVKEFVRYLNSSKNKLHEEVIYLTGNKQDIHVEVAMQYATDEGWSIHSYANGINTRDGGTHLVGFKAALTRILNEYAKEQKLLENGRLTLEGEDAREGLTAIIAVKLPNPQFEGQTKTRLVTTEARGIVESVVYDSLKSYFSEKPRICRLIVLRTIESAQARIAAREARELVRKKAELQYATLPGKLADCETDQAEIRELFIVEGDSAGGSAKQARNRRFQAVLPLRGKILNVEKHGFRRILENAEIRSLIAAIGVGIGDDCQPENLRYGKVILMTDADIDGAHIRTLLLTFFYRHMIQLIEGGRIFIAQPPLYRVRKGNQIFSVMTEQQRREIVEEKFSGKVDGIQRFKGLGEMNPSELWETAMNPETRTLLQVTVEDAAEADKIFSTLMGEMVEPRRQFIQEYADEVDWLDI